MRFTRILAAMLFPVLALTGCYYDNEEDLYSQISCDTTNVTFSQSVAPIFNSNCTACHNNVSPTNNIDLTTYNGAVAAVNTGRLIGAITWQPGYFHMPKGGNKLSDCDISKIEIWINAGMPNN